MPKKRTISLSEYKKIPPSKIDRSNKNRSKFLNDQDNLRKHSIMKKGYAKYRIVEDLSEE